MAGFLATVIKLPVLRLSGTEEAVAAGQGTAVI
jgi:hypothetical protein